MFSEKFQGSSHVFLIYVGTKLNRLGPLIFLLFSVMYLTTYIFLIVINEHFQAGVISARGYLLMQVRDQAYQHVSCIYYDVSLESASLVSTTLEVIVCPNNGDVNGIDASGEGALGY